MRSNAGGVDQGSACGDDPPTAISPTPVGPTVPAMPRETPRHIAIVGGGIGGLATALRLRQAAATAGRPLQVSLLEAGPRLGGVVATSRETDGCVIEHGPDSIIRTKPAGLRLLHDLGLESRLIGTTPGLTGALIARGQRLLPIPPGLYLLAPGRIWPFLWSRLMSWPGKLRMGLDLLLPRRAADLPEESLAAFVRRRLGHEALARIAQPLVGGIYTADPERLSLAHCMPQFPAMERDSRSLILAMRRRAKSLHGSEGTVSGARYGLFLSLPGGLQELVDALVVRLRADPQVRLHTSCAVTGAVRDWAGWKLRLQEGGELAVDALALCLPAHAAARLLEEAAPELAQLLAGIEYASVATINLAFEESDCPPLPTAAGFVVPDVEHRHLIACTFAHRKYPDRAPSGTVLLRAFVGGACHAQDLAHDDAEQIRRTLSDLRRFFPALPEPRWSRVHRWPRAMAQPLLGHRERLAAIRVAEAAVTGDGGHPLLALVGNGYEGVGIPDLCEQAERAAGKLVGEQAACSSIHPS